MNIEQTKTRILKAITELSSKALAELQLFFDFLQFKEKPKSFEKYFNIDANTRCKEILQAIDTDLADALKAPDETFKVGFVLSAANRLKELWDYRNFGNSLFAEVIALLLDVLRMNVPANLQPEQINALRHVINELADFHLSDAKVEEMLDIMEDAGLQTMPTIPDADWESNKAGVNV